MHFLSSPCINLICQGLEGEQKPFPCLFESTENQTDGKIDGRLKYYLCYVNAWCIVDNMAVNRADTQRNIQVGKHLFPTNIYKVGIILIPL